MTTGRHAWAELARRRIIAFHSTKMRGALSGRTPPPTSDRPAGEILLPAQAWAAKGRVAGSENSADQARSHDPTGRCFVSYSSAAG